MAKDRGVFTEEYIGKYGIQNGTELHLVPYIQYLAVNRYPVDPAKINAEERTILQKWRDEGKLTFSMSEPVTLSRECWDWFNNILWDAYVLHKEEEDS